MKGWRYDDDVLALPCGSGLPKAAWFCNYNLWIEGLKGESCWVLSFLEEDTKQTKTKKRSREVGRKYIDIYYQEQSPFCGSMPAAELQRFFTTKINGLSGQSPFQGKMLRNKLIKKPSFPKGKAMLVMLLLCVAIGACLWNSRSKDNLKILEIGRKGGNFIKI